MSDAESLQGPQAARMAGIGRWRLRSVQEAVLTWQIEPRLRACEVLMSIQFRDRVITAVILFAGSIGTVAAQEVSDKLEICMSCHGETGNSEMKGVPSLAGRPAFELAQQLRLFRRGERQNPEMIMATHLTDEEIEALASYFAKQVPHHKS